MVKSSKKKTNKMKMVSGKSNTMKKNMQKKSKKVLLSKLVARNKFKKMMKGGENSKYAALMKDIDQNPTSINEIDLSNDGSVENKSEQPSDAVSSSEPSRFFGLGNILGKVTSAVKGITGSTAQKNVTSDEFSILTDKLRVAALSNNVTSIKLANNGLSSLKSGAFDVFDNVNSLDLSNNNFTNKAILDIFTSSQRILPNLSNLNLSGNPAIQDLTTSLKQSNPSLQINLNMVSEKVSNNTVTGNVNNTVTGNVNTTGSNTTGSNTTGSNTTVTGQ